MFTAAYPAHCTFTYFTEISWEVKVSLLMSIAKHVSFLILNMKIKRLKPKGLNPCIKYA